MKKHAIKPEHQKQFRDLHQEIFRLSIDPVNNRPMIDIMLRRVGDLSLLYYPELMGMRISYCGEDNSFDVFENETEFIDALKAAREIQEHLPILNHCTNVTGILSSERKRSPTILAHYLGQCDAAGATRDHATDALAIVMMMANGPHAIRDLELDESAIGDFIKEHAGLLGNAVGMLKIGVITLHRDKCP